MRVRFSPAWTHDTGIWLPIWNWILVHMWSAPIGYYYEPRRQREWECAWTPTCSLAGAIALRVCMLLLRLPMQMACAIAWKHASPWLRGGMSARACNMLAARDTWDRYRLGCPRCSCASRVSVVTCLECWRVSGTGIAASVLLTTAQTLAGTAGLPAGRVDCRKLWQERVGRDKVW